MNLLNRFSVLIVLIAAQAYASGDTPSQEEFCQSKSQGNAAYIKDGVCWVETDNACNENANIQCRDFVEENAPILVCFCQG